MFATPGNLVEFISDMIIHFPGLKPGVSVFSNLLAFLDCRFSKFALQEVEWTLLTRDTPIGEASIP
jgi:hypothetical protein